ncbi:MAG: PAS domain S-box protein [Methyloligellaceae bacterium]
MPFSKDRIFQTVFEDCPDAVIVADVNRDVVAINPAFTDLFGYAREEIEGNCARFLYADPADFEEQGRLRYNPDPVTTDPTYVVRYRKKSGVLFFAEVRGQLFYGEDGQMEGYVGLIRDIDKRVKLNDLMQSVIALSSAHDTSTDDVVRSFLRAGCTYFDLECAVLMQAEDNRLRVRYAIDPTGTIKEGSRHGLTDTFCDMLMENGQVQTYCCASKQGLAKHPGCQELGLESYIGTQLMVDGSVYGTLSFSGREACCDRFSEEDETLIGLLARWVGGLLTHEANRLKLETLSKELAANARRFERIYRETPAMLHSIDPSGRIVEVSDFWLDKMGYGSRDDVVGCKSTEFLTEASRTLAESEIIPAFWQTGLVRNVPYEFVRRDGSVFEGELSAILDRADEAEPGHSLAVTFDVTERNRALRQLESKNEELQQLNEELERFASVASHDLQEPLRKIQTFSRYLAEDVQGKLSSDGAYALSVMSDAAGRMRQLISDLLAYSHAAHAELVMEQTDLNALVISIVDDLAVRVQEAGAEVRVEALPKVHCDQVLMRQLFQNLLSNALKYREEDRACRIRINAARDAGRDVWRVQVKDNGIGFDREFAEQIFLPFQRLHGRSEFDGSGFGLSICKRIAERHGWSLGADAIQGEGATFMLTIPDGLELAGAT